MKRTGIQCVEVSLSELLQLSQLAKCSLSALRIKSSQTAHHMSRLLGRGMEFAESRRYQSGDDVRNIDWKVTARSGKAHTKLFAAEKERQVLLCVDLRSPMFFASRGVFKSVQASLMAGLITWNTVQTGDRLGGMIFDNENHYEFRPALGKRGALPFLEQLAKSSAYAVNKRSAVKSMDDTILRLKRHVSPGCVLFIFSDFRSLTASACDMLIQMTCDADIRLCFISDALEATLPKNGTYPVTDGKRTLDVHTYDKNSAQKYQQQFIERKEKIATLANHNHIHFMNVTTEDDCVENIKQYFNL